MNNNGQRATKPADRSKSRLPEASPVELPPATNHTDGDVEAAVYRQALERARADMQAFAYSVSHDLRAPLRAIQGFSKILLEDFSAQLDDEAQSFLKHIIQNTQTLSGQMDDLLRFSRAGKSAPSKLPIETTRFVREVVSQLEADLPAALKVEVGELPKISADPVLIRQALTELIQNAAKFTGKASAPRVEITGKEDGLSTVLCVRDNGVGFDPAHADKMFQVFQKLHSPVDFPGNGIGLAIVKRIVEGHGGCVEAEGVPDAGAAFYIALPAEGVKTPLECVPKSRNAGKLAGI